MECDELSTRRRSAARDRTPADAAAAPARSESQTKDFVVKALEDFLASCGFSRLKRAAAMHWVRKVAFGDDLEVAARVRAWLLHCVNGTRHRRGVSPLQLRCPELIPGLAARPFWDAQSLPWVAKLEARFDDIRAELLALRTTLPRGTEAQGTGVAGFQQYRAPSWANAQGKAVSDGDGGSARAAGAPSPSTAHDRGDWNVFYLLLHNVDFDANCDACPATVDAIRAIPRQYEHAFFSALAPGTHVTQHNGPTNKKLRCHLPIVVGQPGSARLRVANEVRTLEEGRCIVFDDSFEHEAWNDDEDASRLVLIVDVWHPSFAEAEVRFMRTLLESKLRMERSGADSAAAAGGDVDNMFAILERAPKLDPNASALWSGVSSASEA